MTGRSTTRSRTLRPRLMQPRTLQVRIRQFLLALARMSSLVCICLFLSLPLLRVFGLHASVVTTGSMTPALPVDTLVITRPVDPATVGVGDVIAFASREERVVLHRVVEIIEQGDVTRFRTKGDANRSVDGQLVHQKHVYGRLEYAFHNLGAAARLTKSPLGMLALLPLQAPLIAWAWRGPSPSKRSERASGRARRQGATRRCASCGHALAPIDRQPTLCPSWLSPRAAAAAT